MVQDAMQTLQFTQALKEILRALKINELAAVMQQWLLGTTNEQLAEMDKKRFTGLLFDSHAGFDRLKKIDDTKRILERFSMAEMYEPARLQRMIVAVNNAPNSMQLRTAMEFYPFMSALRSLQKLEAACTELLEKEKIGGVPPDRAIAEVELIDYDGKGIEPERLEVLATTIRDLHTLLVRFYECEGDQLRFKYFDSGSGTKIGIECVKIVAENITTLLVQYWDKVMFHKFNTFGKGLDAATQSLAFIETVQEKVDKKVISAEMGQNLTHRVLADLERLIGAGVTAPLAEVNVDQRARLLEMQDIKLLESGDAKRIENDGAAEE